MQLVDSYKKSRHAEMEAKRELAIYKEAYEQANEENEYHY